MSERAGVVTAFVQEVHAEQGRVRVEYRGMQPDLLSPWAYIAAPLSGNGRGALFMPEPGDEVLICYGDGDFGHPYVVGFLWNGEQTSPETDASNRVIVTPGGHQLRFEDREDDTRIILRSSGSHALTLEDREPSPSVNLRSNGDRQLLLDDTSAAGRVLIRSAQHRVLLDDVAGGAKIEIQAGQGVGVTIIMNTTPPSLHIAVGPGNSLDVDAAGVALTAAGKLDVKAGGAVTVNTAGVANVTCSAANVTAAGATNLTTAALNVSAGIANFAGVVRCSALVSNAVVSPVYTPGLGNLI